MDVMQQVKQYALQKKLVSGEDEFNDKMLEKAIESTGVSPSSGQELNTSELDIIRKEVLDNPDVYKLYKLEPKRQLMLKKKSKRNRRFI